MASTESARGFPLLPDITSFDQLKGRLDLKNTDLRSSLRSLVVDLYSVNVLKGIRRMSGRVVRRIEDVSNQADYQLRNYTDSELFGGGSLNGFFRYKVWPDNIINTVWGGIPPNDEGTGRVVVDCLPDCSVDGDYVNAIYNVGDPVWITFEDIENFRGWTIKKMNPAEQQIYANGDFYIPQGNNPSSAFPNGQQPNNPNQANTGKLEDINLTDEEKANDIIVKPIVESFLGYKGIIDWAIKNNNTEISASLSNFLQIDEKAKKEKILPGNYQTTAQMYCLNHPQQIWKYAYTYKYRKMKLAQTWDWFGKISEATKQLNRNNNYYLALEAAEAFAKLSEKWQIDNANGSIDKLYKTQLISASMYRTQETQRILVLGRYKEHESKKYYKYVGPGGIAGAVITQSSLNDTGHMSGNAVDFFLGRDKNGRTTSSPGVTFPEHFSFPVFEWLNENARAFNFYPTAASLPITITPEAWHWSYVPNPEPIVFKKLSKERIKTFSTDYAAKYASLVKKINDAKNDADKKKLSEERNNLVAETSRFWAGWEK